MTHLEFDWESPVWHHWLEQLGRGHTLVRYDERGCGLSDWDVADLSLAACVFDLETVVDAARLDRFALLGISQGGATAIAYSVRHPERVTELILYGAYARGRLKRDLSAHEREEAETLLSLIRVGWGSANPAFRRVFSETFVPGGTPEQHAWFDELAHVARDSATSSGAQPRTPSGHAATLGVANNGSLGKILVDSKGRTLYLLEKDAGTKSACTGECATDWPQLRASGKPVAGTGLSASKIGTTARSDGAPEVTYNSHDLASLA